MQQEHSQSQSGIFKAQKITQKLNEKSTEDDQLIKRLQHNEALLRQELVDKAS